MKNTKLSADTYKYPTDSHWVHKSSMTQTTFKALW